MPGKMALLKLNFSLASLIAEDHTSSGSAQGLVSRSGHYIRIRDGTGMKARCHQSCDMCHIYHQYGTHFVCYFTELLGKSMVLAYAEAPAMIILGLHSSASSLILS